MPGHARRLVKACGFARSQVLGRGLARSASVGSAAPSSPPPLAPSSSTATLSTANLSSFPKTFPQRHQRPHSSNSAPYYQTISSNATTAMATAPSPFYAIPSSDFGSTAGVPTFGTTNLSASATAATTVQCPECRCEFYLPSSHMSQHLLNQQPQQRGENSEFDAAQYSSGEGVGTPSTISTGADEEENAQLQPRRSPTPTPSENHPSHWGVGEVVAWLKKVRRKARTDSLQTFLQFS